MSKDEEIHQIPYVEGEPAPGPEYILAKTLDDDGKDLGLFWVKPGDLQGGGPLCHQDLGELLPMVRWTWRHLHKYLTYRAFEEWERGFLQDAHPEREVAIWAKTTYAFLEFTHRNPTAPKAVVFSALVSAINGRADKIKPKAVARQLDKLYRNTPKALANRKNFTAEGHFTGGEKHLR
jgi:hypothetical protein